MQDLSSTGDNPEQSDLQKSIKNVCQPLQASKQKLGDCIDELKKLTSLLEESSGINMAVDYYRLLGLMIRYYSQQQNQMGAKQCADRWINYRDLFGNNPTAEAKFLIELSKRLLAIKGKSAYLYALKEGIQRVSRQLKRSPQGIIDEQVSNLQNNLSQFSSILSSRIEGGSRKKTSTQMNLFTIQIKISQAHQLSLNSQQADESLELAELQRQALTTQSLFDYPPQLILYRLVISVIIMNTSSRKQSSPLVDAYIQSITQMTKQTDNMTEYEVGELFFRVLNLYERYDEGENKSEFSKYLQVFIKTKSPYLIMVLSQLFIKNTTIFDHLQGQIKQELLKYLLSQDRWEELVKLSKNPLYKSAPYNLICKLLKDNEDPQKFIYFIYFYCKSKINTRVYEGTKPCKQYPMDILSISFHIDKILKNSHEIVKKNLKDIVQSGSPLEKKLIQTINCYLEADHYSQDRKGEQKIVNFFKQYLGTDKRVKEFIAENKKDPGQTTSKTRIVKEIYNHYQSEKKYRQGCLSLQKIIRQCEKSDGLDHLKARANRYILKFYFAERNERKCRDHARKVIKQMQQLKDQGTLDQDLNLEEIQQQLGIFRVQQTAMRVYQMDLPGIIWKGQMYGLNSKYKGHETRLNTIYDSSLEKYKEVEDLIDSASKKKEFIEALSAYGKRKRERGEFSQIAQKVASLYEVVGQDEALNNSLVRQQWLLAVQRNDDNQGDQDMAQSYLSILQQAENKTTSLQKDLQCEQQFENNVKELLQLGENMSSRADQIDFSLHSSLSLCFELIEKGWKRKAFLLIEKILKSNLPIHQSLINLLLALASLCSLSRPDIAKGLYEQGVEKFSEETTENNRELFLSLLTKFILGLVESRLIGTNNLWKQISVSSIPDKNEEMSNYIYLLTLLSLSSASSKQQAGAVISQAKDKILKIRISQKYLFSLKKILGIILWEVKDQDGYSSVYDSFNRNIMDNRLTEDEDLLIYECLAQLCVDNPEAQQKYNEWLTDLGNNKKLSIKQVIFLACFSKAKGNLQECQKMVSEVRQKANEYQREVSQFKKDLNVDYVSLLLLPN